MSNWPSAKAKKVLAALESIGWRVKRQSGSHKTLEHADHPDDDFAFHEGEEIGPRMLSRIAKHTALEPGDL
ncbi:type II toxin-antitoxin system HicA family toxin [Synechococcus sp. CS-1329]|uniref:type II toxin-antitoxin system HicA family toxin n=1 Tax=Synechococcus sp. CS-1329 TaxID=2847975 RepID=UPI00223BC125|nr:type II toxin-antitoxin system HicA family toxin [Synechococcus sp. CS-1329]MCT0217887.1 type II toxin-antitoxin system HicA family toxin [Synechococcus sp. CS-1329]